MFRAFALGFLLLIGNRAEAAASLPKIIRVYPLGGQAGTSISLEILGERLSNITSVEFDCDDLSWEETTAASSGKVSGVVSISSAASLGPHMLRIATQDGYSTSAIFNVGQFPSILEAEPNERIAEAQKVQALPVEIQGRLDGAADIDQFAVHIRAGERWVFDLRSIEQGSAVEARMLLLDSRGTQIAFNDDRADFDDNPLIEHRFEKDGTYYVKLDQYRGPRGFNFGKNCSYILRISALPALNYTAPLGARRGRRTRFRIAGSALEGVQKVYLTEVRRAEYARMTYPYTMPIHFRPDPSGAAKMARIDGKIISRRPDAVEAEFAIPAEVRPGLWRLWTAGAHGISDGITVEISDWEEYDEAVASKADWTRGGYVINGALSRPGEKDVFRVQGIAGKPLHFWTLAGQIGVPHLDSVLRLRDEAGKKLAENDDVVAGQGTLIGNPDSSLFYTPKVDGPLFLEITDRVRRGGPSYHYRLKVSSDRPGFQLFTTPENFAVQRGGTGEIKVHLIREAGFEGEVSVWFEGMPPGVEAPRGKFRADQLFEPNADGADMIIPELTFQIQAPESLQPGTYPIRVFGAAAVEESSSKHSVVQAQTVMMLGPLLDLWNFVRRPMPYIAMTVCEPFEANLSTQARTINLQRGKSATLELKLEHIPENTSFQLMNLPPGVTYGMIGRQAGQVTLMLEASPETPLGSYDISAEVQVGNRRAPSPLIALSIEPIAELSANN